MAYKINFLATKIVNINWVKLAAMTLKIRKLIEKCIKE
jgi:hypothetical protein